METAPAYAAAPAPGGAPMYAAAAQPSGAQIQCGQCHNIMMIPPTCPPGSHVSCPTCQTTLAVPGSPQAAQATTVVVATTQKVEDPEAKAKKKKKKKEEKAAEEAAFLWFVLGWFMYFPWIGGLFYWNSKSAKARSWARASLVGFCVYSLCVLVPIGIYLGMVGSIYSAYGAYDYSYYDYSSYYYSYGR